MTKITVDQALLERLGFLSERVELCDAAGRTLAYVTPVQEPIDPRLRVPQVSDEELDRRMREDGGRSLAEIMADLQRQK